MVEESKQDVATYREKIKELIATHPVLDHVKGVEVHFGEDSAGDPAVFIPIIIEDDKTPSPRETAQLSRFAVTATTTLLQLDPHRWPYLDFRVPA